MQIDQPTLSLQPSVYLNTSDPMNAAVLADYSESAVQSARAVRDHLNSTVSDEQIVQEVQQMIQFEVNLAEILADPTGRYKDNRWNNLGWESWLTYQPLDRAADFDKPLAIVHSEAAAIPQGVRAFLAVVPVEPTVRWLDGVDQFTLYDGSAAVADAADTVAAHFAR